MEENKINIGAIIGLIALVAVIIGAVYLAARKEVPVPVTTTTEPYGQATSTLPIPVTPTNSSTSSKPIMNSHTVSIKTNKGTIVFETYDNDAPKAVQNFITLAQKDYYKDVIFHRVIKGFMIQGGDPTGTGRGGPGYQFEDELNPATESYKKGYVRGTVAMANSGPNTNGSQFFIMHNDYPLPNNYTIFGHVVSGMDVVDAIATTAVDGGDRPLQNVVIQAVTVAKK